MGAKKKSTKGKKAQAVKGDDEAPKVEMPPEMTIDTGAPAMFYKKATHASKRRQRLENHFDDLSEMVIASDHSRKGMNKPSGDDKDDFFPTLQVAYMARAMGLNLSQDDVVFLVELVEEDGPSSGAVSKARLKAAIVDALLTNILGGEALAATGLFPPERLQKESHCVPRQPESLIYQALKALDTEHKGYVDAEELRAAMTSDGDRFSDKEVEEMILALADPETGRLNYEDAADILASE